jgi:hypothetical protein
MLQIAFGGFYRISDSTLSQEDILEFHEPGFLDTVALEFEVDECDQIYFVIQKREDDSGEEFSVIDYSNFTLSIKDSSNGEILDFSLDNMDSDSGYYYSGWDNNNSYNDRLIATLFNSVQFDETVNRIRKLDCTLKDNLSNECLFFRVFISELSTNIEASLFHYIHIRNNEIDKRLGFSLAGKELIVPLKGEDSEYVLVSPMTYFQENDDSYDFSYPIESIFYKRQITYNDEDFVFSIVPNSYSYSFIEKNISFFNVPEYSRAAVLLIDKSLYNDLSGVTTPVYLDINAYCVGSEVNKQFRIYFVRS